MKYIILLLIVLVSACNSSVKKDEEKIKQKTAQVFGDPLTEGSVIPVASINEELNKNNSDSLQVIAKGTVVDVCKSKGCWMKLDLGNGETMRVSFKDYGFFVPKDSEGSQVIIQGVAKVKNVDVEELRHYAKDAGKSQQEIDKITEPSSQLTFVASGVEMEISEED